jgi:hypothetical protein
MPMMNTIFEKALNYSRRKYYSIFKPAYALTGKTKIVGNIEYGNKIVKDALLSDKPVMIARIGTTECGALLNYLGVTSGKRSIWKYITWKQEAWWWNWSSRNGMTIFSGFFPTTSENLKRFGQIMLNDLEEADILISLTHSEEHLKDYFKQAKRVTLPSMEPYFSINPWTHALKGKKVLVVHPMVETFKKQWAIREKIWPDGMMPDFELMTIKAVQTVAGEKTQYNDWFEALEWMKQEISKVDFDICIIGAGAYGFPLAAHVKRMGKKAIHMAGATQLLFGVRGSRWETDPTQPFTNFMNEYWVRPGQSETPKNANMVEGACYW